jgi:hypothetical protein
MLELFARLSSFFRLRRRALRFWPAAALEIRAKFADAGDQRSTAARTAADIQQLRRRQRTTVANAAARFVEEGSGIEETLVRFHV